MSLKKYNVWLDLKCHPIHPNEDLILIKYETRIFQAVNVYFVLYLIKLKNNIAVLHLNCQPENMSFVPLLMYYKWLNEWYMYDKTQATTFSPVEDPFPEPPKMHQYPFAKTVPNYLHLQTHLSFCKARKGNFVSPCHAYTETINSKDTLFK